MEQKDKKGNRFRAFLKRNFYYVAVVLAVLTLAGIVAITTSLNTIEVNNNNGGNETPVNTTPTYFSPLAEISILKDYGGSVLFYNDTLELWESHKGINFSASSGAEVYAICAGTVSQVYESYLEGNVVVITHADGLKSIYASLAENVAVEVGDTVTGGDVVGYASATKTNEFIGENQLYLEVRLNDTKVNPHDYVTLTDK